MKHNMDFSKPIYIDTREDLPLWSQICLQLGSWHQVGLTLEKSGLMNHEVRVGVVAWVLGGWLDDVGGVTYPCLQLCSWHQVGLTLEMSGLMNHERGGCCLTSGHSG